MGSVLCGQCVGQWVIFRGRVAAAARVAGFWGREGWQDTKNDYNKNQPLAEELFPGRAWARLAANGRARVHFATDEAALRLKKWRYIDGVDDRALSGRRLFSRNPAWLSEKNLIFHGMRVICAAIAVWRLTASGEPRNQTTTHRTTASYTA